MQFSAVFAISVAMLSSMSQGFVITNCKSPHSHNLGDNQCHRWTDGQYNYQSNKGCSLMFFTDEDCKGKHTKSRNAQNECKKVGLESVRSMRCST